MMPTENQQLKATPNRPRQGGRQRNTPKQTAYASENDIPRYKSVYVGSPSTPASETIHSLRASLTNPKQQNKSKNTKKRRNKDGASSSLDRDTTDCESPSLQSKITPGPIFAGSTFHASPAPSSLPIPSFLNIPEIDSPGTKAASSPEQDLSSATTDSEEASPPSPPSVTRTDESPLEFFFRADRAEKEKARIRRASSSHADMSTIGAFSPPHESPKEISTFPKSTASTQARRPQLAKRNLGPNISPDVLDRNPRQPIGPAFSTPYQERMRAAGVTRSNPNSTQASPAELRNQDLDSLKRYLFTGRVVPGSERPQRFPLSNQAYQQDIQRPQKRSSRADPILYPSHDRLPRGMFPASVLTGNIQGRQSPAPPVDSRADQIATMEDDLKRILKLDSSSKSLTLH